MARRFRKPGTPVQKLMTGLMALAFLALLVFLVPELIGIFSPASEDTWSEWVWDQDLWLVLTISGIFALAAVLLAGAAWHFIEGYGRRRTVERRGFWRRAPEVPDGDEDGDGVVDSQ